MTDEPSTISELRAWFADRLPSSWFVSDLLLAVDREEVVVVGELAPPDGQECAERGDDVAAAECIERFRDESRAQRVRVAEQAEVIWGRRVSWGVRCGSVERLFTTLSVPVMTRLRLPERTVLDTLIDAGVARSRSEALAWCVRLVGQHEADWIRDLREAVAHVEEVRRAGPSGA
jgi:hypothetical protein